MPKAVTEASIKASNKDYLINLIEETLEVPDDLDVKKLSVKDLKAFAILNLDSINEARNASEQNPSAVQEASFDKRRRKLDPSVDLYIGRRIDLPR